MRMAGNLNKYSYQLWPSPLYIKQLKHRNTEYIQKVRQVDSSWLKINQITVFSQTQGTFLPQFLKYQVQSRLVCKEALPLWSALLEYFLPAQEVGCFFFFTVFTATHWPLVYLNSVSEVSHFHFLHYLVLV